MDSCGSVGATWVAPISGGSLPRMGICELREANAVSFSPGLARAVWYHEAWQIIRTLEEAGPHRERRRS